MVMDTTLVTFFFHCPAPANSVELFGSWDNFHRPYRLERDRRRGPAVWTGCFSFRDIICDGDPSNPSNVVPKRDGALKEGGTYWYYYRVNDEELHNPHQPSTTFCPLYPGQRLNILEIPMESTSGPHPPVSDAFTRDPQSRYLSPVPPKSPMAPRLGDLCRLPFDDPMVSSRGPHTATSPPTTRSLSRGYHQRSRSATTSHKLGSGAIFLDLKALKEKAAALKRSPSPVRTGSHIRDLQIGHPILISTTAEDVNVVPLGTRSTRAILPPHVTSAPEKFSPLRSHPVDTYKGNAFALMDNESGLSMRRPRSQATPGVKTPQGRIRANLSEMRRVPELNPFPNEPWMSSPKTGCFQDDATELARTPKPPSLAMDTTHGRFPEPRQAEEAAVQSQAYPTQKLLPALPQYLVPAPLFAFKSANSSPTDQDEREDFMTMTLARPSSRFSTWSVDSISLCSPTSDEDAIYSPIYSSFTSDSSQAVSPSRDEFVRRETTQPVNNQPELEPGQDRGQSRDHTASPPKDGFHLALPRLSVSSVIPKLFDMELLHPETMPRRHAACFGYLDRQGSSPCHATGTGLTSTRESSAASKTAESRPTSEASHNIERLVSEFGFLGQAVH